MNIPPRISKWLAPGPGGRNGWFAASAGAAIALATAPKPWTGGASAVAAAGGKVGAAEYAVTGLWWGGVAILLWLALAAAFARWLARPLPPRAEDETPRRLPAGAWGVMWIFAAVVMLAAAIINAPRLSQSLWDDEDKSLRTYAVGRVQQRDDGSLRYRETTWAEAFFHYPQPNNHPLFTALAKASHNTFAHPHDTPGKPYFSEAAFRLPAFIAGLLVIPALGWMLCTAGFQRAALWAMPLLALHPWFLRYLVEGRGYAQLMLFTVLALGGALHAVRDGRWRWWTALGLLQVLMLFTYPAWAHFLIWLHPGLLATIWLHPARAARPVLLTRWLASTSAAAVATLALLLPLVTQMADYLGSGRDFLPVTARMMADLASLFLSGTPWHSWSADNPLSVGLADVLTKSPWLWAAAIGITAAPIAGAVRLARRRACALLLPAMLLPAITFPLISRLAGQPFYNWYVVALLPGFAALVALGIDWPAKSLGHGRSGALAAAAIAAVGVLAFAHLSAPQREITQRFPIEPKRECVLLTRAPFLNPWESAPDEPVTIHFHQENLAYDPKAVRLNDTKNQQRFDEVIEAARTQGRRVFVEFGQEGYARLHFEHIFSRLDDPTRFRRLAELPGLEPQNTRVVMEMLP